MASKTYEEFLEHAGIKGMKWGKRKAVPTEQLMEIPADYVEKNKKLGYAVTSTVVNGKRKYFMDESDPRNRIARMRLKANSRVRDAKSDVKTFIKNNPKIAKSIKDIERKSKQFAKNVKKTARDLAHEENIVGDFLEHYGVQGMKWGVTNDTPETKGEAFIVKTRDESKRQTKSSQKKITSALDQVQADMLAKKKSLTVVNGVNDKYRDEGLKTKERLDSYNKEIGKELTDLAAKYTPVGLEPSVFVSGNHQLMICVGLLGTFKKLTHADSTTEFVQFPTELTRDADGFIIDIKVLEDELAKLKDLEHSDNIVGEFLEHYGVLGMKWGVRKDARSGRRPGGNIPEKKPKHGTFSTIDKSTGKTLTIDYNPRKVQIRRTAQGFEITGKSKRLVKEASDQLRSQMKSGAEEKRAITAKMDMSDDQLRSAINRIQMEKTYKQLTAKPPKESSAMSRFMINAGSQILSNAVTNVGGEYLKQALKVNIDKNISPDYRIMKAKKSKD